MDEAIVNAALVLFGEEPLADGATPRSPLERAAVREAPLVRREVLQKQRWTVATRAAVVQPEDGVAPPPDYGAVGVLPPDCLAVWDAAPPRFAVQPDRRVAWSGAEVCAIEYAADVPAAQLDPLLLRAIGARLAARIATVKADRAQDLKVYADLATQAEMEAAARDALNRREAPLLTANWLMDGPRRRPPWME